MDRQGERNERLSTAVGNRIVAALAGPQRLNTDSHGTQRSAKRYIDVSIRIALRGELNHSVYDSLVYPIPPGAQAAIIPELSFRAFRCRRYTEAPGGAAYGPRIDSRNDVN